MTNPLITELVEALLRGETESQKCEHVVSVCGAGLSGICVLCGHDVFAEQAEAILAKAKQAEGRDG